MDLKSISKFLSLVFSENGVWLTDAVPPEFIEFPDC